MADLIKILGMCGLLLFGSIACSPADASPREVVIDIAHSHFTPSAIKVEGGTTVTFVIHNSDPIDHEFLIGDQKMQDIHEKGTEVHHGARPGEISVPALSTRTTTYTFARSGGSLFGCHLPGHYSYGMRGTISIR